MKTAKNYPVKYKFGYSAAYGSSFHTGEDRSTPYGTPVIVNKTLIGYTGNSGYVLPKPTPSNPKAGSHLHISRVRAGRVINPRGTGFKLRSLKLTYPKVVFTGTDDRNGKHVIIRNSWGDKFYYDHLSKINVKVGQRV